jgi:uncharacterized protein
MDAFGLQDFSPGIIFGILAIFLAAIVRGFSGFGFSLLAVSALTLFYAPAEVVPAVFMLEIAASLHLLPTIWSEIHWRSLLPLIAGCLIATPFGVYALAHVPEQILQIALSAFVLVAVVIMWRGYALERVPGTAAATGVGAASGLFNGAFGIGGPPVIIFYFASPAGVAAGRASIIAYFLATDGIGLANLSVHGLVTWDAAVKAALFLPALIAGVWFGARAFKAVDAALFRRLVLVVMAVLALIGAGKALAPWYWALPA